MVLEIVSFLEPAEMLPLALTNQRLNAVVMSSVLPKIFATSSSSWGISFGSGKSCTPFPFLRYFRLAFYNEEAPNWIMFYFKGPPKEVLWQMTEALHYLQTSHRVPTIDLNFQSVKPTPREAKGYFRLFVDICEELRRCHCSSLCLTTTVVLGEGSEELRKRLLAIQLDHVSITGWFLLQRHAKVVSGASSWCSLDICVAQ